MKLNKGEDVVMSHPVGRVPGKCVSNVYCILYIVDCRLLQPQGSSSNTELCLYPASKPGDNANDEGRGSTHDFIFEKQ